VDRERRSGPIRSSHNKEEMNKVKCHIRRGDLVEVISGNHKGSNGKVLEIRREKSQVLIEGVHMIKKHQRKSQDHPNGAIIEREGPIHASNIRVLERSTDKNEEARK